MALDSLIDLDRLGGVDTTVGRSLHSIDFQESTFMFPDTFNALEVTRAASVFSVVAVSCCVEARAALSSLSGPHLPQTPLVST
jgi:hypothetical protein